MNKMLFLTTGKEYSSIPIVYFQLHHLVDDLMLVMNKTRFHISYVMLCYAMLCYLR